MPSIVQITGLIIVANYKPNRICAFKLKMLESETSVLYCLKPNHRISDDTNDSMALIVCGAGLLIVANRKPNRISASKPTFSNSKHTYRIA